MQAELGRATELQKRAEREREELVRLNQHLEERVSALDREKNLLEQDLEELRSTDCLSPLLSLGRGINTECLGAFKVYIKTR